MKKSFICLSLSFFILSHVLAAPTALDYYGAGKAMQQREDYTGAIEQYQEALLINPDFGDVWISLAECAYEMDEYERALDCLETADKYFKNDIKIQHLKGFSLIGLGRLEEAKSVFDSVLKKYPNDIESMFGLAQLQIFDGKFSAAESYYSEALYRQTSNKKALLSLALVSLKLGKEEQAENFINQAIKFHSDNPEVYYYASYIEIQKGNLNAAEGYARTAVKLDRNYDKANALLSYILYSKGEYEKTVELSDFRISKNRKCFDAWYLKALSAYKLGAVEQAVKSLEKVLDLNPQDEIARACLEQIVCENLDIEDPRREEYALYHVKAASEAVEKYNSGNSLYEYIRALKIHPLNLNVRLSYSDWLLNEGYPEAALSELKFIQSQGNVPQLVSDRIESYDSILQDSLGNRWNVDPFYLDKGRVSIGLYYYRDSLTILHADSTKICTKLVADTFDTYPYFKVKASESSVKSYSEAFKNARKNKYDYFGILNFDETERENTISIKLYSAATGSEVSYWEVYRTGNKKLSSAVQKITSDIASSFRIRGRIIARDGTDVLIDIGQRDGVSKEDKLLVAEAGTIKNMDREIGLSVKPENELGLIELKEVGEDLSEGVFKQKGFYDRMNPKDEVLILNQKETKELEEDNKKSPSAVLHAPEFLEMLNSIR